MDKAMNIEKAIEILNNRIKTSNRFFEQFGEYASIDKNVQEAIETVLADRERLEKECDSKEKAYNDFYCEYKHYKQFESISKDKIKDIVNDCIPKGENRITGKIEYQPNANANSYLTQRILELLKGSE